MSAREFPVVSATLEGDVLVVDLPDENKPEEASPEEPKKFQCPYCDADYDAQAALTSHLRFHNETVVCAVCGKRYSYIAKHLRVAHGADVYSRSAALKWMENYDPETAPTAPDVAPEPGEPEEHNSLIELLDQAMSNLSKVRTHLWVHGDLRKENEELRARLELIQEAFKA